MITPIDLANALQDLTTTIRMSYVDEDGSITAYEANGTARAIMQAVYALAEEREKASQKKQTNADRIRNMSDEELMLWLYAYADGSGKTREQWIEWLKKEVDDGT